MGLGRQYARVAPLVWQRAPCYDPGLTSFLRRRWVHNRRSPVGKLEPKLFRGPAFLSGLSENPRNSFLLEPESAVCHDPNCGVCSTDEFIQGAYIPESPSSRPFVANNSAPPFA